LKSLFPIKTLQTSDTKAHILISLRLKRRKGYPEVFPRGFSAGRREVMTENILLHEQAAFAGGDSLFSAVSVRRFRRSEVGVTVAN